jgi:threonine/homoserine/homoserine lactone efflux protein
VEKLSLFLLEAALISLSGVMAPGPITAVTVGKGSESPHAGAWVAIGHGIVEFPLIALIFWGFGHLLNLNHVKTAIALVGGLLLLLMGIGMFRSIKRAEIGPRQYDRFPVIAGILLSAGNPFFLIWWVTVGAALISRAAQFGMGGLLAFALVHWSCDLTWCYFLVQGKAVLWQAVSGGPFRDLRPRPFVLWRQVHYRRFEGVPGIAICRTHASHKWIHSS